MTRTDNLTTDLAKCHKELALEYFNAGAGLQDSLDSVSIMNRYPQLYTRETYEYATNLQEHDLASERERQFLKRIFTANYVGSQTKELQDELANAEGDASVQLGEEIYPYRALPVVLANTPDYALRGKWDAAYIKTLAGFNGLREQIDQQSRSLLIELGYESLIDAVQQLSGMRVYPLRDQLAQFIKETHDTYEIRLTAWAEASEGLTRENLRHGDIGYVMRAGRFDNLFPAGDMVPALARTLKGLGIDLDSQDNTTIDLEQRPKKSPRAFCIGIDTPRDVRLIVTPRGGQDDYSTLFHEAGHLEFGAHMGADLPFIYKHYGDTSVHESYAFLLQHLLDDPIWWREIMGVDPGDYLSFTRFHRLYFVRRYGAKLNYEVEYDEQGGGRQMAETYAKWLERGTGIPYPTERYLDDFDSGFYVLQYLQAWIWEVQLRDHLKREFGEAWFLNRAAGDFLRDLWREGMKFDIWEIAEQLGYDGLDIKPLQSEVMSNSY